MNVEQLRRSPNIATQNETMLPIIDAYRREFADITTASPLEMEFPYLEIHGKERVSVLETGDNLAGTFKWRGAVAGAYELQRQGYDRIIAASAGNHACGGVLAARALDMSVDIVVPTSASLIKREKPQLLWPSWKNRMHVAGKTFDESLAYAYKLVAEQGGALLHPYDDEYVIKGQGTIVDDLLREKADVDHIVLPVGGGGLLAGVIDRLKELGRDDIYVTAVEAPGSNSLSRSLLEGGLSLAEAPNQAFGGSAVRFVGHRALRSARSYSNLDVVTADVSDINYVIETYHQSRVDLMRTDERFVPAFEPTSLVAVAGLYKVALQRFNSTVVVGTGHNAPLPIA